ncbi:MAG: hypothetical protein J7K23_01610 [Thermoproteales archaeon]|nr:hypothetical protein [Thermoproteales archaeon]
MGRIKKGIQCSVKGCDRPAIRSISYVDFSNSKLSLEIESLGNRVYLCREHYKEYKKATKKLRKIDKWRWV